METPTKAEDKKKINDMYDAAKIEENREAYIREDRKQE